MSDDDRPQPPVEHAYPAAFPKGAHWAVDEAWDFLDGFTPGAIPNDIRFMLAGYLAGYILRAKR